MRLGKVEINTCYIVDLDNEEMVQHAKDSLYDDFYQMLVKSSDLSEFFNCIDVVEDATLKESDIPEFLRDEEEEK